MNWCIFKIPMASLTPTSLVRILRQPRLDMCLAPIRDPRPPSTSGHSDRRPWLVCRHAVRERQSSFWCIRKTIQCKPRNSSLSSFKTSYCPWATESFSKHVIFKLGSITESRCIYIKGKYFIWNILTLDSPLPLVGFNTVPLRMKKLVLIQCAFLHLKI